MHMLAEWGLPTPGDAAPSPCEVKRIVDEQYQRGMKLLRDNIYLLDELAKMLMEQEKVSGRVHIVNRKHQ